MTTRPSAAEFLPRSHSLAALRRAAAGCQGCDLFRRATQTVFGEGPAKARLLIVGEVPGDKEDEAGRPFVGPAGKLLRGALDELEIPAEKIYVTNAVKHFKWEERGTRRLHSRPSARETTACRPWLIAEIEAIRPEMTLCLGALAGQSLLGAKFRITQERGKRIQSPWTGELVATWHPSAILRAPEKEQRERMRREFVEDLQTAWSAIS